MRAAPALDANLDDARLERALIVTLHLLAGLAWLAWGVLHASPGAPWWGQWPMLVALALAFACLGWLLARRALPEPPGSLCWTGQRWCLRWRGEQALRRVQVTLDLGAWLLLRLQPATSAAPLWRIARAHSAGAAWHALRVALHAHAGPAQPADDAKEGVSP
jgi:hypothetical protein